MLPSCATANQPHGQVTRLLDKLSGGSAEAAGALVPLIYAELHRLASNCMRRERSEHTLQPTALVHEAYLRLVEQRHVKWKSREHFYSVAAKMMRRILLDFARRRLSSKRGGSAHKITLDEGLAIAEDRLDEILAVDEALNRLAQMDERQGRMVELCFFGGLSLEEAARILDISAITAKRDWSSAKAWLFREMSKASGAGP